MKNLIFIAQQDVCPSAHAQLKYNQKISGDCRPKKYWLSRSTAIISIIFLTCGCSTARFTQTAGQFGALTQSAAEQQNTRLGSVADDVLERYRQDLADKKADLRYQDCAALLPDKPELRASSRQMSLKPCRLVQRLSEGKFTELDQNVRFKNITALNSALADYASSLVLLAADASKDQQAFTAAVTNMASSLGGLDGAIRKVVGGSEVNSAPRLNAVGALVAKIGNIYFAARRQSILKKMVIEADPLVARAAEILGDADSQLNLYYRAPLYKSVVDAQTTATEALKGTDVGAIRAAQTNLFTALERYKSFQADRDQFAAIGRAHGELVKAAKSGATAAELQDAIVAVVNLASTIGETKEAFKGGKK